MADVGEQGTAVSALKSLCEMMKKSPGDLQKALLRPGTVEFELIASAVKQAELDEAKFVTSQASAPSQATAPSQAPLDKADLSRQSGSQQVEDYLSAAYERSHRGRESPCESEAEMPAQPQPVKDQDQPPMEITAPAKTPQQEPMQNNQSQPMEIVPQVSQQPDPLKNSQSQPMEIVPQVFQQPDPVKNSQSQPMEIVPAAQGHEAVSQQSDFMNQVQLTAPALQQAAQVFQQSGPLKNPSQPAATVVQDLPPQSQGQPGQQFDAMPPPLQIPDRSAVNPAPNSSAPTTPIPSDAEDDKALRDMKDYRV